MEQEHRITYKAGITRTPSDFLCQDGELAECINLATDNEELKPVVQPVAVADTFTPIAPILQGFHLLYVHKFNDDERYIGYTYDTAYHADYLCYATKDGTELTYRELEAPYTETTKVTSIGKTLIVSDKSKISYFLWKLTYINEGGERVAVPIYENMGEIPDPVFDFSMYSPDDSLPQFIDEFEQVATTSGDPTAIVDENYALPYKLEKGKQEDYNNLVVGLYGKNKKTIADKRAFCEPFFVRTAIKMYDGTYTHISQPILMMPFIDENSVIRYLALGEFKMLTFYAKLYFSQSRDFSEWSDIVSGLTIFVSRSINIYDTQNDVPYMANRTDVTFRGIYKTTTDGLSLYQSWGWGDISSTVQTFGPFKRKSKEDLIKDLQSVSQYYKLCDIGREKISNKDVAEYTETYTLANLTNQERIEDDDWFSRTRLCPSYTYSYNSRLNLANVSRSMFEGFDFFLPYDNTDNAVYDFYVRIATDIETIWVHHQKETKQKQGIYFYYPDSRANRVTIYKTKNGTKTCICDHELKEHPNLNGAYYIKKIPTGTETEETVSVDPIEGFDPNRTMPDINNKYNNDYLESLPNYIIQSDVNNPWLFPAKGYHKVGTGKIIGMSTITQALSQGQFGQYPLLVFSESGIWAMSVNSTGLYQSIQPMSRDVCLNPNSILQTDGTVFFVSKKGLMVIVGNEVRCVSELMNGRAFNTAVLSPLATGTDWAGIVSACQGETTFLEYIRDETTFMSYDYIDSRIIITKPGAGFSFAYNIADGTISKVILPAAMTGAVNNYPDYLLQGTMTVEGTTQNRLYSYYEKPREENVAERQLGFVLTRPMKLAGPVSQASLRQLMNVGTWRKKDAQGNELSCVKTEIYLSEDMQTWFPDISRYGAAARYYRLALFIKMLPTERLSGTILTEQERRAHNMR